MKKTIFLNLVVLLGLSVADAAVVEVPLACEGQYGPGQSWTTDFDLGVTFTEITNVYIDWSGEITAEEVCPCADPCTRWPVDGKFTVMLRKLNYYYEIANAYTRAGATTYPAAEPFELRLELPELNYEPRVLLVRFVDATLTNAERNVLLASFGGGTVTHSFTLVPGLSVVELPEDITVQEALAALENAPGILYAEPNYFLYPAWGGLSPAWGAFLDGHGIIEIWFGKIYRSLDLCTVEYPSGQLHSATLVFEGTVASEHSTRLVPQEYTTIQDAIDACVDGDVVIVAPGTYTGDGNRDIDFLGKAITVRSIDPNDPNIVAVTIIDCNGTYAEPHRGFYFHSNEDANSVLNGLTITNGYVYGANGAGICCESGSPTITNCIITGNITPHPGVPRVGWYPGGYGGGIYCEGTSEPTIINCVITGNTAGRGGGGVCGPGRITNCTISSNTAGAGGAVYGEATISNCTITNNEASYGGGIDCGVGLTTVISCLIVANRATQGGGISCEYEGHLAVSNCTIAGNSANGRGGGISLWWNNSPVLSNCILWDNTSEHGSGQSAQISGGTPTLNYCCIQGWTGELEGIGTIGDDPLITRDLHLQAHSPCTNAGDPDYIPRPGETDIDNEARICNYRLDMGCDEFVDTDADGLPDWWEQEHFGSPTAARPQDNPDGDQWTNIEEYVRGSNPVYPTTNYFVDPVDGNDDWDGLAPVWDGQHGPKATIQAAINQAEYYDDDQVILAEGTYTGSGNCDIDLLGKAIIVRSVDPNDPNIVAATVIDCNGTDQENHRGFYLHSGEEADTIIDGVTIVNGYCRQGGAVYCDKSSLTMRNCVIYNNTSEYEGGGIFCRYSNPQIINCVICENRTLTYDGKGAGICCYSSSPIITNCTIEGNESLDSHAGGICCYGGRGKITDCAIIGNSARGGGGGIYFAGSKATVVNCIFWGNSAAYGGGIGHDNPKRYNRPTIADCLFIANSAEVGGGLYKGFYPDNCHFIGNAATYGGGAYSVYDIKNCTFTANVALDGGGMYIYYGGPVTNCIIIGNRAERDGGGIWCLGSNISNSTITGNKAHCGGGLFNYNHNSMRLSSSILWGNIAQEGNEIYVAYYQYRRTMTVTHSNIEGGYGGVYVEPGGSLNWRDGNIDADPCFVSPGYWADVNDPNIPVEPNDPNAIWIDGDYHLLPGSPCIDAGDNSAVPPSVVTDLDGKARIINDTVDMGAYEYANTAPVACIVDGNRIVECGGCWGARVTLDGSCSSDGDSTAGTNDDIVSFDWYKVDACDPNFEDFLASGEIIDCNLPLGEHIIVLEVIDKADAFDTNEVRIIVQDTTPPEFMLSVTPTMLWPANHKMVLITPSWTVSDICDESPIVSLKSITMNEGDEAKGDGHTADDIQIGDDGSIYLRAERSGTGSGRIYTITYQAVDDSGNAAVASATVTVPHDQR